MWQPWQQGKRLLEGKKKNRIERYGGKKIRKSQQSVNEEMVSRLQESQMFSSVLEDLEVKMESQLHKQAVEGDGTRGKWKKMYKK